MRFIIKKLNLLGQRFGRLVVIDSEPFIKNKDSLWKCKCDCGNIIITRGTRLKYGVTKSCGCLRKDTMRETQKRTAEQRLKTMRETFWNKRINDNRLAYNLIKNRAVRAEKEFSLSFEECLLLFKSKCAYCDSDEKSIIYHSKSRIISVMGIDRKDSFKGYILSNVVPCCKICNAAKMDMSVDSFYEWIKRVYEKKYGE